jgi:hypothetical protein
MDPSGLERKVELGNSSEPSATEIFVFVTPLVTATFRLRKKRAFQHQPEGPVKRSVEHGESAQFTI